MQVAVDAAELLGTSPIPAATQRSTIWPSCQRLTLAAWSRQMAIIDSIEFVDLRVRASVGGTPSRMTVSVSASPTRSEAAAPGYEYHHSTARTAHDQERRQDRVGACGWTDPLCTTEPSKGKRSAEAKIAEVPF